MENIRINIRDIIHSEMKKDIHYNNIYIKVEWNLIETTTENIWAAIKDDTWIRVKAPISVNVRSFIKTITL